MVSTGGVARWGMLVAGLGIGAAVAHAPVASADSSSDLFSSIDGLLSGGAVPAPASGLDLAISYDGYSLVQDGTAVADTASGEYGLAIADGNYARALDIGTGGFAGADGSDALAYAGGGTGDVAEAQGTNAQAAAGGDAADTGADNDTAIDIGNNDLPPQAIKDGAYAGNSDLDGDTTGGTGSGDTAIDIGNNTNDASVGDGAFAGAGGLVNGGAGDGNDDTAIDVGNNSGENDSADAVDGNGNYASEYGSTTGLKEDPFAGGGNGNIAISDNSYDVSETNTSASGGDDNYAWSLGPENSFAEAGNGNSDLASVVDPFGSTASEATANGGNSDLAAVVFTDGVAFINTGGNYLYDILTASGPAAGMF